MNNQRSKYQIPNTKTNKGITLIALIITIIVLLILAVVAIGAVQNDGIINHAKNARDQYGKAGVKENTTLGNYLAKLEENVPGGNGGTGNTGDESDEEVYVNDYGAPIEYSVDLNNDGNLTNDWKVFYKDDTHWYIIASDYLENTNLPTDLNMSTYYYGGHPYSAYWNSTSNFTASKASDSITTAIASKYNLSWFSDTTKDSTDENARATADLLNVEAWTEKFGKAEKGIEAIGGPTLEMWVASWNAKGAELGTDKYVALKTEYDSTGYFVGPSTTTSLSGTAEEYDDSIGGYKYNIGKSTEGYNDELYFPHREYWNACYGYWLASPSAGDSDRVMRVSYNARVNDNSRVNHDSGVRPLVSVPSNLITSNADGLRVVE